MTNKMIAQQSVVRVGSICVIFGEESDENNGLTCVASDVYFKDGEWWSDVCSFDDEKKFLLEGNLVDFIAIPVNLLMSIGDTEMEEV